jgi:hypothetical protein
MAGIGVKLAVAKGSKKSKGSGSMRKDITGFLQSQAMDRQADYLLRGRSYQHLSDAELLDQFVATFEAWTSSDMVQGDPDYIQLRKLDEDLTAELDLRSIPLPTERITDAMERLVAKTDAHFTELKKDPDE